MKNELTWLIGGPQGSGVDSSANIFGRACAYGGLQVFGKREYYSNIMGEHSYFQIRVSEKPIHSHMDPLNVLATFEAETLFRHAEYVTDDGAIVYDPEIATTKLSEIPTIEARAKSDLRSYLMTRGVGESIQDALNAAKQRGVTVLPVPMADFLAQVAKKFNVDQLSKLNRMVNVLAVSTSLGLLGYDFEQLKKAIHYVFRAKKSVAEMNTFGAELAYAHGAKSRPSAFAHQLVPVAANEKRIFVSGA